MTYCVVTYPNVPSKCPYCTLCVPVNLSYYLTMSNQWYINSSYWPIVMFSIIFCHNSVLFCHDNIILCPSSIIMCYIYFLLWHEFSLVLSHYPYCAITVFYSFITVPYYIIIISHCVITMAYYGIALLVLTSQCQIVPT